MDNPNFPPIPNSVKELQEHLADSAADSARIAAAKEKFDQPGWDGKRHDVPPGMGPGAANTIQGRATGSPFDNMPSGISLGPLQSILNVIIQGQPDEIIPWSWWPMMRDRQLRKLWRTEGIAAGAFYAVISRMKAMPWTINDPSTRRQARYQDVVQNCDLGEGWGNLIPKTILDLLTQDNGAFWEKLGPGDPDSVLKGPVLGFAHLDSGMCWRTHDMEFPVIYINPYTGQYHGLHRSRVVRMSSMPQSEELARGVGFCATSRVIRLLRIAYAEQSFKDEKISGRFKRGLIYGTGFTRGQFDKAVGDVDQEDDAIGLTAFGGIPVLLTMHEQAKLDMLELARLPDGFDFEKEITIYVYALALALGTDAREIWPATSSGATKADASTQHMKAQGKGIADLIQTTERAINWDIFPEGTTFAYGITDEEREKLIAETNLLHAQTQNILVLAGIVNPQQAQNQLAHDEVIDLDIMNSARPAPVRASDDYPLPVTTMDEYYQQEDTPPPVNIKQKALAHEEQIVNKFQGDVRALLDDFNKKKPPTNGAKKKHLTQGFAELLVPYVRQMYAVGLNKASAGEISDLKDAAKQSYTYWGDSFVPDFVDRYENADGEDEQDQTTQDMTARAQSYAGVGWSAMWMGVAAQLEGDEQPRHVQRVLDDGAQHCETCPDKAGTYDSFADMDDEVGVPADGSDDCLSNCRCRILVESEPGSGDFGSVLGDSYDYANTVPEFSLLSE